MCVVVVDRGVRTSVSVASCCTVVAPDRGVHLWCGSIRRETGVYVVMVVPVRGVHCAGLGVAVPNRGGVVIPERGEHAWAWQ